MKTRYGWTWLAAAACAMALTGALQPGDTAPDLGLRDASGKEVRLSAYRQKKDVVLLAPGAGVVLAPAVLEDAARRLATLETVVLVPAGDEAGRKLLDSAPSGTVLIDTEGRVRRVISGQVLTGADLAASVGRWQSGKAVYQAACARCHGEDGDLHICEEVKPLAGIGRRLTEAQILERLRISEIKGRDIPIRGYTLTRQEVDEVIAYVASL